MRWLLVERYLGRSVIVHTLVVLAVLLVVLGFVELSIQLGKLNERYTLELGVLYTLLKLPVYGYEVFPVALLIGTLMGLGALASRSELIVLRTGGWSVRRIFLGTLKSVLLFALVMVAVGEYVAPASEALAKKLRAEALQRDFSIGSGNGLWLRQDVNGERRYVWIRKVISDTRLSGITLFRHDVRTQRPLGVWRAPTAYWDAQRQTWRLEKVRAITFDWPLKVLPDGSQWPMLQVHQQVKTQQMVALALDPQMLTVLQVDTRYMGIGDLLGYIAFLRANQLDARPYELALWRKAVLPLTLLAMIAIVFPLVFGSIRQVSMGHRVFVGILIGLGYHYLNQLIGNLTLVYELPLWLGVLMPPLLLGVLGFYGIWRLDRPR